MQTINCSAELDFAITKLITSVCRTCGRTCLPTDYAADSFTPTR